MHSSPPTNSEVVDVGLGCSRHFLRAYEVYDSVCFLDSQMIPMAMELIFLQAKRPISFWQLVDGDRFKPGWTETHAFCVRVFVLSGPKRNAVFVRYGGFYVDDFCG